MLGRPKTPKVPWRERYRTSRAIFREAFRMLPQNKDLWIFPILGVLGMLAWAGLVFGIGFALSQSIDFGFIFDATGPAAPLMGLLFLPLMYPAMVVASVLNGALVYGLYQRMAGRPCNRADAWRAARSRLGVIARFNLVALLVAGLLQFVGILLDKLRVVPYIGTVFQTVGAFGWATAAYFVFPVIVVERETSALAAIRKSTALARQHWGKSVAGVVTIGLVLVIPLILFMLVLMVPTIFLTVFLAGDSDPQTFFWTFGILMGVVLVGVLAASLVQALAQSCYQVALYRYATTGRISPPFSQATLVDAWKPYQGA